MKWAHRSSIQSYITKDKPSEVVKALIKQHIIFKYVTQYCLDHPEIGDIEDFDFKEYGDFKEFVKNSDFRYQTKAEEALNALTGEVFEREMDRQLRGELSAVAEALDQDKATHLDKYKDEIIREIELDIAARYYFENGKTIQKLKKDPELQEAISILESPDRYRSVLN